MCTCTRSDDEDRTLTTMDDTDDVRTSRLGVDVGHELKGVNTASEQITSPHPSQSFQPVSDFRRWPCFDVTMATRIQPSSTVELGSQADA